MTDHLTAHAADADPLRERYRAGRRRRAGDYRLARDVRAAACRLRQEPPPTLAGRPLGLFVFGAAVTGKLVTAALGVTPG